MSILNWINTGAFAAMIVVNALANLLPIGGNTTAQVSEAYPNLFTPAPITFAIWGVIYLLLVFFILYQWGLFDKDTYSSDVRKKIGLWFAISCILNILWLILWHNQLIGLSTICITLLLITLAIIQKRLRDIEGSLLLKMSASAGFSIYFGWIIVAAIANCFTFLTKITREGWGVSSDSWTVAVMLIGAIITCAIIIIQKDRLAGIAVIWAYSGILIRHISPAYFNGNHPFVIITGFLSVAVILAVLAAPFVEKIAKKFRDVSLQ